MAIKAPLEEEKKTEVQKQREIQFSYKFEPGEAKSSFGIAVAYKAGMDERVLEIATRKAA